MHSLADLGWKQYYQRQLEQDEQKNCYVARVSSINRGFANILSETGEVQLSLPRSWRKLSEIEQPTVGDWLVLKDNVPRRVLERKNAFTRRSSGLEARIQLVAANIDTIFIVTSCNQEFNVRRIERYLALVLEAGVEPVVVLTKADLTDDSAAYVEQARALRAGLAVVPINAVDPDQVARLKTWCPPGRTISLVGSSGVGKSTIANSLGIATAQLTGEIREIDGKGRHTTTGRSLHLLPDGGLVVDTPGMREIQLPGCRDGLAELFEDIEELAAQCRFRDCAHEGEAGCAVEAAVQDGTLDPERLQNYLKMLGEQERSASDIAERRRRDRESAQTYKAAQSPRRKQRVG